MACNNEYPLYNLDTRECTKCPEDTTFIESLRNCSKNIYITDMMAPRILETDRTKVQTLEDMYQRKKQENPYNFVGRCPPDTPFFDGQSCIDCRAPTPLFNIENQMC